MKTERKEKEKEKRREREREENVQMRRRLKETTNSCSSPSVLSVSHQGGFQVFLKGKRWRLFSSFAFLSPSLTFHAVCSTALSVCVCLFVCVLCRVSPVLCCAADGAACDTTGALWPASSAAATWEASRGESPHH